MWNDTVRKQSESSFISGDINSTSTLNQGQCLTADPLHFGLGLKQPQHSICKIRMPKEVVAVIKPNKQMCFVAISQKKKCISIGIETKTHAQNKFCLKLQFQFCFGYI